MGILGVDFNVLVGIYVELQDWNDFILVDDVVMIDM